MEKHTHPCPQPKKKGKKEKSAKLALVTPGVLNYLNGCFQYAVLSLHQNLPTSQATSNSRAFIYFDSITWLISICIKKPQRNAWASSLMLVIRASTSLQFGKTAHIYFPRYVAYIDIISHITWQDLYFVVSSSWFLISCINLSSAVLPCLSGPVLTPTKWTTQRYVRRVFSEVPLQWKFQLGLALFLLFLYNMFARFFN